MVFPVAQMDVRSISHDIRLNTVVLTQSLPKKNSHCSEVKISCITTPGEDVAKI